MKASGIALGDTDLVDRRRLTLAQSVSLISTSLYRKDPQHLRCASVGMICFSVDPQTKNIFILLGKETCFHNFQSGRGMWCDFGGRPIAGETHAQTATREFVEESLTTTQIDDTRVKSSDMYNHVLQTLNRRDYYVKIEMLCQTHWISNNHAMERMRRIYYVKEIPWQPQIRDSFQSIRNTFVDIKKKHTLSADCPSPLRQHPGLILTPRHLQVNSHYLEKHCVQWWSLDRLCKVIHNRGRFKNQRFRRSFLPILQVVVRQLKSYYE